MIEYFPPLDKIIIENILIGQNAKSFFDIFFSDEAPHSFKSFHAHRGDTEITLGKWQEVLNEKPFRYITGDELKLPAQSVILERNMKFSTMTKGPLGKNMKVRVNVQQRASLLGDNICVVEFRNTFENLPYSQCFCVWSRWKIETKYADLRSSSKKILDNGTERSGEVESKEVIDWKRTSTASVRKLIGGSRIFNRKRKGCDSYLRVSMDVQMLQNTLFENKIRSIAEKIINKYLNTWLRWHKGIYLDLYTSNSSSRENSFKKKDNIGNEIQLVRKRSTLQKTFLLKKKWFNKASRKLFSRKKIKDIHNLSSNETDDDADDDSFHDKMPWLVAVEGGVEVLSGGIPHSMCP